MSEIQSPPLKWHGGKHYLAKRIIELMPPHTHYVEPYFGGGAVLLEKDPVGVSEVVNDIHGELINFWECLQNVTAFKAMQRKLSVTPFSEDEWLRAVLPGHCEAPIDGAIRFFVRCRQSRAGQFKEFATLSRNRARRGMNEQASAWLSAVEGLPAVHARLKRVVILCGDALEVIRQQDGPKTLFYLDPPYLHETRASTNDYQHEITEQDHGELLKTLAGIKGRFLLSGYRSPLYDSFSAQSEWQRFDFDLPNNAAGGDAKRRMTECVWANYNPKP